VSVGYIAPLGRVLSKALHVIMLIWERPKEATVMERVLILSLNPFSYRVEGSKL